MDIVDIANDYAERELAERRQVEASTWREAEQQCRDGEIVNGELIGVYDCDPVTEAVCTARNDVMIESLEVCCG